VHSKAFFWLSALIFPAILVVSLYIGDLPEALFRARVSIKVLNDKNGFAGLYQKFFRKGLQLMKTLLAALGIVLLIGSTSIAGWYVGPTVVQAYYPAYYPVAPVYAYPARVVVAPAPYVTYMPVAAPAPYVYGAPVPMLFGPPAVVRAKVYYPGQPVRNVVKAVLP